ncbi:MAG: DUF4342 domain-containing protein [Clostridia bacterium]|nr:DUF4342 domain-containing protein [Clostridia bacterium]
MEITLEKIELVKDRTGVGYKEAKDALEKANGSVVDAIILIEDCIDESTKETETKTVAIIDQIKDAVRKGNVTKITISKDGETVLNLPVNIGIVGTLLFPWAIVAATVAALGTKCTIELTKEDGDVIDVSAKAQGAFETVKDKSGVLYDEVKDKGGDIFEAAKDKGGDFFEAAKDKGGDLFEAAKGKGGEMLEKAKETREHKAAEAEVIINENDFDLSDLDLDGMEEDNIF